MFLFNILSNLNQKSIHFIVCRIFIYLFIHFNLLTFYFLHVYSCSFRASPTGRSGRQRIRGERKKERKEKKKAGYECTHICLSIRTFIVMYLAHRYALRKTRREETLVTLLAREKQIRDQGRRDRLVRPPTEPRRDYTTVRDGEREKKRRRKNEKERGTWAEFRQNAA